MRPADYSLTPHRELEYEWGDPPARQLLDNAPRTGRLVFTRLVEATAVDARGRPGCTVVELVTDAGRAPLPAPICVHSPTGFEWGYGGSGPADLAANLLALFCTRREAWRLHQRFKWDFVAPMDKHGAEVPVSVVRDWLEATWATERADAELMAQEAEAKP